MNVRKWLETGDLNTFVATIGGKDDPGHGWPATYRPPVRPTKNKTRREKKIDKLFGRQIKEDKDVTSNPAGIFFTDGEQVLLLKKPDGKWGLPGGHAKEGESPIQTAIRESKEECGKVKGTRFGSIKTGDWTSFFYKVNKPFKCKLSKEHTDWAWTPFEKMKDMKLHRRLKKSLSRHIRYATR